MKTILLSERDILYVIFASPPAWEYLFFKCLNMIVHKYL